ncbi:MAG: YdeI/OmpD-associated family protein [Arenimonas sp.]
MTLARMADPTYFATPADFRRWLAKHAASAAELLVGFHKVASGEPSMTWPESVDEALCFGWIDGVRKRIDDASYTIRFTPRRPTSIWSAINIAKFQALEADGRMTDAGRSAFSLRDDARSAIYAYERKAPAALSASEERGFKRNQAAWKYWESAPPGYRKTLLHHVTSAKRPETRAARLARLIEACSAGRRVI